MIRGGFARRRGPVAPLRGALPPGVRLAVVVYLTVMIVRAVSRRFQVPFARTLAVFLALGLLAGCSDFAGLLPQVEETSTATLVLMQRGATIRGSFTPVTPRLELTGDFRTNPPDAARISLLDRQLNLISIVKEFEGDLSDPRVLESFNASPGLATALPYGLYYYRAELFLDGRLISTSDTPVFAVAEHSRVVSVSSYPSALISGGYGLLRAQVLAPAIDGLRDPYLVWKLDGKTIAQGLLSEGVTSVAVLAPSRPGVMRAEVQVYPIKPEFEGEFDFVAPVSRAMEVVVVPVPATRDADLGPESEYSVLLHLNGNLENSGFDKDIRFSSTGDLLPGIRGEVFGYEFLPDRWLETSGFPLPLATSGDLANTGIVFSGFLDFLPVENPVTLFAANAGTWGLTLSLSPDGRFVFSAGNGSVAAASEIRSLPGVVTEGEHAFSANLYRISSSNYGVVLFVDGILRAGGVFAPPSATQLAGQSSGVIAAGFAGVVDEFGITAARDGRDSGLLSSGLYHRTMATRYGANLEYAVSFEDGTFDALPNGTRTSGDLSVRPGRLILRPGEWIQLPGMDLQADAFDVHLGLVPDSDWKFGYLTLELSSDAEVSRIVVGLDGFVRIFGTQGSQVAGRIPVADPSNLQVSVSLDEAVLASGGVELDVAIPAAIKSARIRVDQAQSAEGSLGIDHLASVQPFRDLIPGLLD